MTIEIEAIDLERAKITEHELRLELALLMYSKWVWGLTESVRYCGLTRMAFSDLLLERKIPIQYTIGDLDADLKGYMAA